MGSFLDQLQDRRGFDVTFLEFAFWVGIGYDASSRPNIELVFFFVGEADADAKIEVLAEINVAKGASINAAFALFEFLYDLAGAKFGRARKCSCWQGGK